MEEELLARVREDPAIAKLFQAAADEVAGRETDLLSAAKRIADRLCDAP